MRLSYTARVVAVILLFLPAGLSSQITRTTVLRGTLILAPASLAPRIYPRPPVVVTHMRPLPLVLSGTPGRGRPRALTDDALLVWAPGAERVELRVAGETSEAYGVPCVPDNAGSDERVVCHTSHDQTSARGSTATITVYYASDITT